MRENKTYAIILIFLCHSCFLMAQSNAIKSDAWVNNTGELINAGEFTVQNEVNNDLEIVTKSYFNAAGHLVCQRNYDFTGQLMYDDNGVAIYEYDYKENKVVEERYFDENKELYRQENLGAAIIKREYNSNGDLVELAYYMDQNTMVQEGVATLKYEYSADRASADEKHYAANGQLIDYCAPIVTLEFDEQRRIIRKTFKNSNNEKCGRFFDNDASDVAVIEFEYNGDKLISQTAYDKNGQLIGTITSTL